MIFKSIQAQNFLSFDNFSLNLADRGLLLLNGENLDNPMLNNNGAGKSSVLESIVYALYGKTLRGLKGDAIVNKKIGNNMRVALHLIDDDGSEYSIIRYRKHHEFKNKSYLYRNGTDITPKSELDFESYISNLLQADYSSFTASLLYSSESFKFATATDGEIKKIFDTMLGLDVLQKSLVIVKNKLKDTISELRLDENTLDFKNKSLTTIEDKIQELETLKINYEEEEKLKLTHIDQSILALQEKSEFLMKQLLELDDLKTLRESQLNQAKSILQSYKDTSQNVVNLKIKLEKIGGKISNVELLISSKEKEMDKLIKALEALKYKIQNYETERNNLDDNIGKPCLLCGQPLTIESIELSKQELETQIAEINFSVSSILEDKNKLLQEISEEQENLKILYEEKLEIEELLGTYGNFESKFKKAEKDVERMQILLNEVEVNIRVKNLSIKENNATIQQLMAQLKSLQAQKNPFIDMINSSLKDKAILKKEIEDITNEINNLKSYKKDLEFWEVGFSNQGIKSYILDDITPFLNRRLNKYLNKLTSGQIEAVFTTVATLKSGEQREKFNLLITNSKGGQEYIANSGGEKKRIDLSINLALQDLLASRSTKKLNIAIFDEVFDSLDENGVDGVISLLQELIKEKSTILLVSHNEYLKSYFTNVITVIKKDGFSRLEEG